MNHTGISPDSAATAFPRSAVKRADSLVGDVTTEDFRVALRRYRTFFDRLLSI